MSEELSYNKSGDKESLYQEIIPQIESLTSDEENLIANMANVTSVLKEVFDWLWIGFYLKDVNNLVLGPFQGPLACTRIDFSKGVCGACFTKRKTIIVSDVDQFPGHIVCSSLSRSEIVVPGISNGEVLFVLDVDSENLSEYDVTDQKIP